MITVKTDLLNGDCSIITQKPFIEMEKYYHLIKDDNQDFIDFIKKDIGVIDPTYCVKGILYSSVSDEMTHLGFISHMIGSVLNSLCTDKSKKNKFSKYIELLKNESQNIDIQKIFLESEKWFIIEDNTIKINEEYIINNIVPQLTYIATHPVYEKHKHKKTLYMNMMSNMMKYLLYFHTLTTIKQSVLQLMCFFEELFVVYFETECKIHMEKQKKLKNDDFSDAKNILLRNLIYRQTNQYIVDFLTKIDV